MKQESSLEVTSEVEAGADAEVLHVYARRLTAAPRQFAWVRRAVAAQLRLWGYGQLVNAAVLCLTELLSNVHRHAGSPECELRLCALPEGVRLVVGDRSAEPPAVLGEPDWFAERGRGMFLISRTADAWGVEPTARGKDVWVLLLGPSGPSAGDPSVGAVAGLPVPDAVKRRRREALERYSRESEHWDHESWERDHAAEMRGPAVT